jgi:hypothetical protein
MKNARDSSAVEMQRFTRQWQAYRIHWRPIRQSSKRAGRNFIGQRKHMRKVGRTMTLERGLTAVEAEHATAQPAPQHWVGNHLASLTRDRLQHQSESRCALSWIDRSREVAAGL